MKLHVVHDTHYEYTPAVETAQHVVHLKPRDTPSQRLLQHELVITPVEARRGERIDVYGNTRTFFALQSAHEELRVVADSMVLTDVPAPAPLGPGGSPAWEAVRDRFRFRAGGRWDAATEFVFASEYVPRHDDFVAYAAPSCPPGRPVLDAAHDLMRRIHAEFRYESDATEVDTPVLEALAQRRGVCQDFAHIMVACMRSMGIPARYVSGYLLTTPPPGRPRLVGSDASHAWVEVYAPALGGGPGAWYGFDPTNDRAPGEDYIVLAVGRDFGDVSPMRGLLFGGGDHHLEVGVTVEPVA